MHQTHCALRMGMLYANEKKQWERKQLILGHVLDLVSSLGQKAIGRQKKRMSLAMVEKYRNRVARLETTDDISAHTGAVNSLVSTCVMTEASYSAMRAKQVDTCVGEESSASGIIDEKASAVGDTLETWIWVNPWCGMRC